MSDENQSEARVARAKVYCKSTQVFSKVDRTGTESEMISFEAVIDNGENENRSFSKYTPYLEFKMSVTNEALFGRFKPGKLYYLDVIEAE